MKSHILNNWSRLTSSLAMLALFTCTQAQAQTFVEVSRFDTIHGEVVHQEGAGGQSRLRFLTKGNLVSLPDTWGRVSIEQVIDLKGQTAVLMSHSESSCPSRLALAVVSRDTFWGPYAVGGCEDILIHQISEDGRDLIAIRADAAGGLAWVYSSADSQFRSAIHVDLPPSMSMMIPRDTAPVQEATQPQKVSPQPRVAPVTRSTKVPAESSLDEGEELVAPRKTAKPALGPVRTQRMTPQEASAVSQQVRKAPADKVLRINL